MKMRIVLFALLASSVGLCFLSVGEAQKKGKYRTIGKVKRFDKALDKLVPKNAKIEVIVKNHVWTEGPCWVPTGKYLLFSDIPRNSIYKWQEGKGESLFLKPSGYTGKEKRENETGKDEPGSNGIELYPPDHIILCEHGDRQVSLVSLKTKKKQVLATRWKGKRLNSPNDAVVHSSGNIYFTDPPYGLKKRFADPARELKFTGVYRISGVGKTNKLTLLTKKMSAPNGIAFSLDEKTLYVANSDPLRPIWMAFEVKKDGTLGESRVFYSAAKQLLRYVGKGLPDGMCIDHKGNLFATGPGGVFIFTPKGKLLGLIYTGERTSNCTFGDDGRTLYMTTDDYVTRIRLKTKGKGF